MASRRGGKAVGSAIAPPLLFSMCPRANSLKARQGLNHYGAYPGIARKKHIGTKMYELLLGRVASEMLPFSSDPA